MRRREFITLLGSTAATWPLAAWAQHPAKPVVGFLNSQSPDTYAQFPAAFRQGLRERGIIEGENVTIEYRWAHGHNEQLAALAADLARHPVNVIAATGGLASVLAAKAATGSIPIVFNIAEDPVQAGLVASLNRPGGNLTGVSWFSVDSTAKRLAMLHDIVPTAGIIGYLTNPQDLEVAPQLPAITDAAREIGIHLVVVNASTAVEIDAAFARLLGQGVRAIFVGAGSFFINQRAQLIELAAKHAIPCIYSQREFVVAGGMASYGNDLSDAYRRNGVYVARILKGDKPGDLPIDRSTRFDLVINLKTVTALGITIPPTLLATADEVIE
jgi:putative ABC transport system substrate-binding protein